MIINRCLLHITCCVLLITLCSCYTSEVKETKVVDALDYDASIKVKKIHKYKDQTDIFNPFRILNVNDAYLIVSELRQKDFFHVFSLPDLTFLYTAGKKGRGPQEFMTPPAYIEVKNRELEIYDPMLQAVRFFNVTDTSLIELGKVSLRYKGQIEPLNRPIRVNDSTYFADYGTSVEKTNNEHVALRPAVEESLFTFGKYPSSDLEGIDRYSEFLKTNVSRTNGGQIATFYTYHNRFKIYNEKGEKLIDFTIDDPDIQPASNGSNTYMYKVTSWASEDYIYLLGIYETKDKYNHPDADLKTSIEVWTWNGRPVYRAKFDRTIHGFTVSEQHRKIYGFSYLNESVIFEYDLDCEGL